jgi:3-hydroxyacyl-[acyl-carrier-protein] dehydratase
MRFSLIDQIVALEAGSRIEAVKNLTLGEEYLADHFPTFPVMPGVLMLEALVQAGAWLIRITEDFANTVVVLREAKGIKYGSFVEPGRQLRLTVEMIDKNTQDIKHISFKGKGEVEGVAAVSGKWTVERYCLKDIRSDLISLDEELRSHYRRLYQSLRISQVKV